MAKAHKTKKLNVIKTTCIAATLMAVAGRMVGNEDSHDIGEILQCCLEIIQDITNEISAKP